MTWFQPTLPGIDSATSSPASAGGPTPCGSPGGPTTAPSGPAPARASRSVPPASGKGSATSGTCGPTSSGSSKPAGRRSSSGSKSRPQRLSALSLRLLSLSRFAGATTPEPTGSLNASLNQALSTSIGGGSMEFVQTWKERVTPSGHRYSEHTARGRRTSASGSTGWPTPAHSDGSGGRVPADPLAKRRPSGAKVCQTLNAAATLARLSGWNTPRATDGSNGGPGQTGGALPADAALAGWATPTSRDHKDGACQSADVPVNGLLGRQAAMLVSGHLPSFCHAGTVSSGVLSPEFSRWLMGFPAAWGCCGGTAMRLCRKSRPNSSGRGLK